MNPIDRTKTVSFASDNHAGVHPEILRAISSANLGHCPSYGGDPWTEELDRVARDLFGPTASIFPVFNGTAANVLALSLLAKPYEAILCADTAHIHLDECGAPERFTGSKLIAIRTPDGKLTPRHLEHALGDLGNQHHVQPRVISISQTTEYGTIYSVAEIQALTQVARKHGLKVHVDGARLSNAAAALGVSLRAITVDCGVDVVSFGGTKNGLMAAEAVIVFDPSLATQLPFVRKQGMQLPSKMRFISVQLKTLFEGGLWKRNAEHANAMAKLLGELITQPQGDAPAAKIRFPVLANALFVSLPESAVAPLQKLYPFYVWSKSEDDQGANEHATGRQGGVRRVTVRWMTSFDTREEDVRRFAAAIREQLRTG